MAKSPIYNIHATIYRGRFFRCSATGIIDWAKTTEYKVDTMRILLDTRHKITLHNYNHGVNTEHKGKYLQEPEKNI
jgi:hypothetical protein